jgi:hypothetical protein
MGVSRFWQNVLMLVFSCFMCRRYMPGSLKVIMIGYNPFLDRQQRKRVLFQYLGVFLVDIVLRAAPLLMQLINLIIIALNVMAKLPRAKSIGQPMQTGVGLVVGLISTGQILFPQLALVIRLLFGITPISNVFRPLIIIKTPAPLLRGCASATL